MRFISSGLDDERWQIGDVGISFGAWFLNLNGGVVPCGLKKRLLRGGARGARNVGIRLGGSHSMLGADTLPLSPRGFCHFPTTASMIFYHAPSLLYRFVSLLFD